MWKVLSLHISSERGVSKNDADKVMIFKGWGLDGDAVGGDLDRQVSIFPIEALAKVPEDFCIARKCGIILQYG